MRHRLVPLVGLLTLCAFLAGCGGSTSTPATATLAAPTSAAASAPTAPAPTATTAAPAAAAASAAPAATAAPSAATTAPAASAPAASAASATTAPAAAGSTTVAVELKDFAIMLDKSTVSPGMVTFNVKNSGPSPHNFNVKVNGEEKGVTTLDPGKTATLTLNLQAGSYDFRCNIPGHDLLGMKGTLTVK
jgi:uncharacterized cupredoxin-like copper-binding protein